MKNESMKNGFLGLMVFITFLAPRAFADASKKCSGDQASSWENCVDFSTNTNDGSFIGFGVVIGNNAIPGGQVLGNTVNGHQNAWIRYDSLGANMVVKGNQIVMQFDDGSAEFVLGTLTGPHYGDTYGFSFSQELTIVQGLEHSESATQGQPRVTNYYRNAMNVCMAEVSQDSDSEMIITVGERSLSFKEHSSVAVNEYPALGHCP